MHRPRPTPSPARAALLILVLGLLPGGPAWADSPAQAEASGARGLTEVQGIQVGHHTLDGKPTGCTVVVAHPPAVAAVDVRGGAPGSREMALLRPENLVQTVDAIVLSGGSAFGLDAASGAMHRLAAMGRGYETRAGRVPIVPSAILFDLAVGDPAIRPGAECGDLAVRAAHGGTVAEGNVGAGAGATVGKLAGMDRAMKSGLGSVALRFDDGLVVAALAAVNAVGDVVDPATGQVVAGLRTEDGAALADSRARLLEGLLAEPAATGSEDAVRPLENTTLVVVATNARLDRAQTLKIAQMAQDGLARSIVPVHTPYDGDTVFALATGVWPPEGQDEAPRIDLLRIGALAAEATSQAILRAVRHAEGLPGLPSASDLERGIAPIDETGDEAGDEASEKSES